MNQFLVNLKNWHFKRAFFGTTFKLFFCVIFFSTDIFIPIKSDT